ncbi:MAG: carbohydrate-binding protein, partial [Planctomycetota bacterium]
MKRLGTLLIFLVISFLNPYVLMAQLPSGTPQLDAVDPHRFVIDGQQWYPSGTYPNLAALTLRTDGSSLQTYYQTLHNKLQTYGINYYRCVFTFGQPYAASKNHETLPYNRSSTPGAADGGNKFDISYFNNSHFDYWRNVIQDADSKGIVVQLCILESWHINKWDHGVGWGLKYDFYIGQNNINGLDVGTEANWHSTTHAVYDYHKTMIREVVDRLGDLPNIVWEVCNEPKPYYESWAKPLGNYLKSYELAIRGYNHVCMPVDLPDHQNCPGNTNVGNIPLLHTDLVASFADNEVLIADNDTGDHYLSKHDRRKRAWAALTAGAHNDYFQLSMGELSTLNSSDIAEGMQYMGYVHKFLSDLSVNLQGMFPSDGVLTNGWCYARSGDEYIIYLISGGGTTVSGLPSYYSATWFNPRDGATQPAGIGPTFNAPDTDDWILYISYDQEPYNGTPAAIPGTAQAEDYDIGGEAIAYHDTSSGNAGGEYRSDDVDITTAADTGGGYCIGWTEDGEWLEYTVDVNLYGIYDINVRVASLSAGGTFHIEANGVDATGPVSFGPTGGWQTWDNVTIPEVIFNAGPQILRRAIDSAGWNLNWIEASLVAAIV